MAFDPRRLTPAASLNRVPFIAAPPIGMPQKYEGKLAFSLLGARALGSLIVEHGKELDLTTEEVASAALSYALRARLTYANPAVAATASEVVSEYGRRLGYLIAILKRGDPESRAARPEWDGSYWAHWVGVERVYLGGGLAWPEVCAAASITVQHLGLGIEVSLPPFPANLPLIGAARSVQEEGGTALVLDFGQTATKRAFAFYRRGALQRLETLPTIPASPVQGMSYIAWMEGAIASSLPAEASRALVCVSSYLDENQHPAIYANGRFNDIHSKIANLREWLSSELSRRLGRAVEVALFHDTTAAGVGLTPSPSAATIMLGTALGVGFPLAKEGALTPLAPDFSVNEAKLSQ